MKKEVYNNNNQAFKSRKMSSMNVEMRNEVTVNSLLMKSLESATREYARQCVNRLAEEYGFEVEEALKKLNLEKLKLQVQEMKKRSGGKAKAKANANAKKEVENKIAKALYPMPFNKENVSSTGCQGLAYNGGLFTQCPRDCMNDVRYCKGCQSEIDKNGVPANGRVSERLACELMEYRDPKGRKPVRYVKIMEKLKISREEVEREAGKLKILIDEVHFVEEEKKVKEKKVKEKKAVLVTKEDDLIAELMDEYEESETSTVIMSEDEEDEEAEVLKQVDAVRSEKEAEVLKHVDAVRSEKEAEVLKQVDAVRSEKEAEVAQKKQEQAAKKEADVALKKQQQAAKKEADVALKKQQQADEKAKKEADVALKKQQQADEKAAKEKKIADEKEQKIAAEKALRSEKEKKIADEKAAKEKKIADEKALRSEKEAELALKKQQQADEKAAKEAEKKKQKEAEKKQQKEIEKKPKEIEKKPKEIEKKPKEVEKKPKEVEKKPKEVEKEPEPEAAPVKKVTVKRITIEGKQYLKTSENLLYDPDTKEEMGIYDPVTNMIKELPNDSEDELSEDEYETEA